jgi:hypothetical protein
MIVARTSLHDVFVRGDETNHPEALIADLLENSARLAEAAYENAQALIDLAATHADRPHQRAGESDEADASALPADLAEAATLHAHAAGMAVHDYLGQALFAYIALTDGGRARDADLTARLARATATARRRRADSAAVMAQTSQARAHSADVQAGAKATQRASMDQIDRAQRVLRRRPT